MTELDLAHFHDVLGQLPRLKTYTHFLLAFPVADGLPSFKLTAALARGAETLTATFPWLACQVVHEGGGPGNSGVFRLAPCAKFAAPNTIVQTKDCTDVCPTYKEILESRGPVSMFDAAILTSVPAFPQVYDDALLNPAPVFTLQANIVRGGVLLDAAAQHNFIDGGGLLRLLELLAKSMRREPFSADEIEHSNRDRSKLIPLLRPEDPMLDHSHLIVKPPPAGTQQPQGSRPRAHWRFVRFPASALASLKSRANEDIQRDDSSSFVSTNDTLSAFVWKRLSTVRLKRGRRPDSSSKFSRAMDARRALRIPREYLGQMGYNATCHRTFKELQCLKLGEVALFMRQTVEKVNTEYSVRSWATFIANEPDKSRIMFGGTFNPDNDIGASSLVHASVHDVDFGLLGKPDLIRRPLFLPLESCFYLWTQTAHGHVDALLCLAEADWDGLSADTEWVEYTEIIG